MILPIFDIVEWRVRHSKYYFWKFGLGKLTLQITMHLLEKYAIKICGFGNTRSQPDQKN